MVFQTFHNAGWATGELITKFCAIKLRRVDSVVKVEYINEDVWYGLSIPVDTFVTLSDS